LTALRRAENAGLDMPDPLCRAASQSVRRADARDLAAVLHTRIERLVRRSLRQSGRTSRTITNILVPARRLDDVSLAAPLRELEAQIVHRID
jgi:hypothetical protein